MNHLNVQVFQCPWLACGVLEVSVCVLSQVPSWQMVILGQPLSNRCLNSSREEKAALVIYLPTQTL